MNPIFHVNYRGPEQALPITNDRGKVISRGTEKKRIHLYNYDGPLNKDKFAIAAKPVTSGEQPKLGFIDKRRYVLYEVKGSDNTSTWYKINKNSLEKRLGITSHEINNCANNQNELTKLIHNKFNNAFDDNVQREYEKYSQAMDGIIKAPQEERQKLINDFKKSINSLATLESNAVLERVMKTFKGRGIPSELEQLFEQKKLIAKSREEKDQADLAFRDRGVLPLTKNDKK